MIDKAPKTKWPHEAVWEWIQWKFQDEIVVKRTTPSFFIGMVCFYLMSWMSAFAWNYLMLMIIRYLPNMIDYKPSIEAFGFSALYDCLELFGAYLVFTFTVEILIEVHEWYYNGRNTDNPT